MCLGYTHDGAPELVFTDGVMHYIHKREVAISLLIQNSNLIKLDGKRNSGLTRFDDKVHVVIYCRKDRVRQNSH